MREGLAQIVRKTGVSGRSLGAVRNDVQLDQVSCGRLVGSLVGLDGALHGVLIRVGSVQVVGVGLMERLSGRFVDPASTVGMVDT